MQAKCCLSDNCPACHFCNCIYTCPACHFYFMRWRRLTRRVVDLRRISVKNNCSETLRTQRLFLWPQKYQRKFFSPKREQNILNVAFFVRAIDPKTDQNTTYCVKKQRKFSSTLRKFSSTITGSFLPPYRKFSSTIKEVFFHLCFSKLHYIRARARK